MQAPSWLMEGIFAVQGTPPSVSNYFACLDRVMIKEMLFRMRPVHPCARYLKPKKKKKIALIEGYVREPSVEILFACFRCSAWQCSLSGLHLVGARQVASRACIATLHVASQACMPCGNLACKHAREVASQACMTSGVTSMHDR